MTPDVQLLETIRSSRSAERDAALGELWSMVEGFADRMALGCARKFPGLGEAGELFGELYVEFLRVVERLQAKTLPDAPWIVRRYTVTCLKNYLLSRARSLRDAAPVGEIPEDIAAPEITGDAFAQVDLHATIAPEVERRLQSAGRERDVRYWRWRLAYPEAPDADFARLLDISNKTAMETRQRVYAVAAAVLLERHPDLAERIADFRDQTRRGRRPGEKR